MCAEEVTEKHRRQQLFISLTLLSNKTTVHINQPIRNKNFVEDFVDYIITSFPSILAVILKEIDSVKDAQVNGDWSPPTRHHWPLRPLISRQWLPAVGADATLQPQKDGTISLYS